MGEEGQRTVPDTKIVTALGGHHPLPRRRHRQRRQHLPAGGRRRGRGHPPGRGAGAPGRVPGPPRLRDREGQDNEGLSSARKIRSAYPGPHLARGRAGRGRPPGLLLPLLPGAGPGARLPHRGLPPPSARGCTASPWTGPPPSRWRRCGPSAPPTPAPLTRSPSSVSTSGPGTPTTGPWAGAEAADLERVYGAPLRGGALFSFFIGHQRGKLSCEYCGAENTMVNLPKRDLYRKKSRSRSTSPRDARGGRHMRKKRKTSLPAAGCPDPGRTCWPSPPRRRTNPSSGRWRRASGAPGR